MTFIGARANTLRYGVTANDASSLEIAFPAIVVSSKKVSRHRSFDVLLPLNAKYLRVCKLTDQFPSPTRFIRTRIFCRERELNITIFSYEYLLRNASRFYIYKYIFINVRKIGGIVKIKNERYILYVCQRIARSHKCYILDEG